MIETLSPARTQVELGRHANAEQMIISLEAKGFKLGSVKEVLTNIPLFAEKRTMQIVVVPTYEICDENRASVPNICMQAMRRGWWPCPAEVGPALREQCGDLAGYSWKIAMKPLQVNGRPYIFMVSGDGLYLTPADRDFHSSKTRWIFAC